RRGELAHRLRRAHRVQLRVRVAGDGGAPLAADVVQAGRADGGIDELGHAHSSAGGSEFARIQGATVLTSSPIPGVSTATVWPGSSVYASGGARRVPGRGAGAGGR